MVWVASSGAALADLDDVTDWLHTEKGLIGVAAGYANSTDIQAISVAGFRRMDDSSAITPDDLWHLGSITKSMTSMLLGTLIDDKQLSLDMPLPDLFPEITVHDGYANIPLRDVLDHQSGLPDNFGRAVMAIRDIPVTDRPAARAEAIAEILSDNPETTDFLYSNIGFTLAGHVAETKTDEAWEDLLTARLFTPLGVTSAGFGAPQGDQPWGHRSYFGMIKAAVDPASPAADNSPIIGPAGTVHMSIQDLLIYGQELLRLARGEDGIIRHETFAELFIQPDMAYRGGLVSGQDEAFGGQIYWHNGSNTMWYALLVIAPEQDRVIAITTNYFGPHFDEYVWEAAREIAGF